MAEYAVYADDREALKAFVRSVTRWGQRGTPVLEIEMPCCGERRRYMREVEIPVNDVRCLCGNWFLKYDQQPFQVFC